MKNAEILDQIDALCAQLVYKGEWTLPWAIRGAMDASDNRPSLPGTSENAVYHKVRRAVQEEL